MQALLGDISAGSAAADLRRFIATDPVLAFFPTQQHTLTQLQSETQSQTQRVAQTDNSAAGLSVPVPLEIQQGRLLGLVGPPCSVCGDAEENWLCLKCCQVFCSFYRSQHMAQHYDSAGHGLCLSLSDGSFWCNDCQSYVFSPDLRTLAVAFSDRKFSAQTLNAIAEADEGDEDASPAEQSQQRIGAAVNALARQVDQQLTIEHSQAPTPAEESVPSNFHDTEIGFTYQQLIRGLREKVFKRVVFLTGAGISVAAGIPDFRTPGTGLYSRVQELGLPYPEAIFSLDYLRERPIAFFRMAKGFLNYKASPVLAHKFMARMDREQQLLKVMTQNIDGLELDAGLQLDKLSQAHGHMRSARW